MNTTHDPTEALAAAVIRVYNEQEWNTYHTAAGIASWVDRRRIGNELSAALSAAGWHLTRAGDELRAVQGLDEAWAEAEAALPEGWHMLALQDTTGETWSLATWRAMAGEYGIDGPFCASVGPTPAAALHALAERLRGRESQAARSSHGWNRGTSKPPRASDGSEGPGYGA